MSWFTKYRPTSFSGLHLTVARETLSGLLSGNTFPKALLFAGPKGTGKTSSARIIGALLNDPANKEAVEVLFFDKEKKKNRLKEPNSNDPLVDRIHKGTSYVVHEMDAASNRGIDDIRSLKERLMLPPQEGLVSVYILDEVHMLTTEAFNALLKVLEEPPAHVVFVLATTELHKVPETIVSRCMLVPFQKASIDEISQALTGVLDVEKIKYDKEAIELIAKQADGSFRDGVKMLESLANGNSKITLELVESQTGGSLDALASDLVGLILAKDEVKIVEFFADLRGRNIDQKYFYKVFLEFLHHQLLVSMGVSQGKAVAPTKALHFLLTQLQTVEHEFSDAMPFLSLELKILEMVFRAKGGGSTGSGGDKKQKINVKAVKQNDKQIKSQTKEPLSHNSDELRITDYDDDLAYETVDESNLVTNNHQLTTNNSIVPDTQLTGNGKMLVEKWDAFLTRLHEENISLELLLRSARPVSGSVGQILIEVYYNFHKEQLQQPKFIKTMQEACISLVGGALEIEFTVGDRDVIHVDDANVGAVENNALEEFAKDVLM